MEASQLNKAFILDTKENGQVKNMSKKCLDFLYSSFLYRMDLCESQYSNYSDNELFEEITRYREYVIAHFCDLQSEISKENEKLNICIESFKKLPPEDLFKQLVLYMDQVVIPDPLFSQSEITTPTAEAFGRLLGLNGHTGVDRGDICKAINYIRQISPLIEAGFVVMMPISLMHEAPRDIPITYSPTAFSDVIPEEILKFYRSSAHVCNMKREGTRLVLTPSEPLTIGTGIHIGFADDEFSKGFAYQYIDAQVDQYDESTGRAQMKYSIAKSITAPQFSAWVNQSINQAANHHFEDKYNELIFSKKCGCMYLSRSDFTAQVLGMVIEQPSVESKMASLAMNIDLPVVSQLPMPDLLSIRNNYGEAFHNFRNELNSKLLSVDALADPADVKKQLDNISYELNSIQVKEVQKEYRKIIRTLGLDAIALSGTLIASFATGGITAVGAAGAFVKGVSDVAKYFTDVNENNGFFLWKLNKLSEKYSV